MNELHADSILKHYGTRPVLTDCFLSCRRGEVVGLFGRNGSGKSTLLKIIFGSLQAENRFVKVGSGQLRGLSDGSRHIKYLPQDGLLPNNLKIKTIIGLLCDKRNRSLLEEHPLIKNFRDKKGRELSGGEKRFLEVMLLIHSSAEFVLIDEPFNGISPIHTAEIKSRIEEQSAHKGFVITDHNYRNVLDIATRLVLIHQGALRNIDGPDDLRKWGYIP